MDAYKPIILTDHNLPSLSGKLSAFPIKVSCIHRLEDNFKARGLGIKYVFSGLVLPCGPEGQVISGIIK